VQFVSINASHVQLVGPRGYGSLQHPTAAVYSFVQVELRAFTHDGGFFLIRLKYPDGAVTLVGAGREAYMLMTEYSMANSEDLLVRVIVEPWNDLSRSETPVMVP